MASRRILLVEDSSTMRRMLSTMLKEDGFEVDAPARIHGSWTFYFLAPGGFVVHAPVDQELQLRVGGRHRVPVGMSKSLDLLILRSKQGPSPGAVPNRVSAD